MTKARPPLPAPRWLGSSTAVAALLTLGAVACGEAGSGTDRATSVAVDPVEGLESSNVQASLEELHARLASVESELASVQSDNAALAAENAVMQGQIEALQAALANSGNPDAKVRYGEQEGLTVQQALDASYEAEQGLSFAASQAQSSIATLQGLYEGLSSELDSVQSTVTESLDELENEIADVEKKVHSPSPCPSDMVAIDDESCMEAEARAAKPFVVALGICSEAGRRVCSLRDIHLACTEAPFLDLQQPTPDASAHWVGDSAGRLHAGEGIYWLSGLALTGAQCGTTFEAANAVLGEGTDTTSFPYRCCTSR